MTKAAHVAFIKALAQELGREGHPRERASRPDRSGRRSSRRPDGTPSGSRRSARTRPLGRAGAARRARRRLRVPRVRRRVVRVGRRPAGDRRARASDIRPRGGDRRRMPCQDAGRQPEGPRALRGAARRRRIEGEGGAHLECRCARRAARRSAARRQVRRLRRLDRRPSCASAPRNSASRGYSGKTKVRADLDAPQSLTVAPRADGARGSTRRCRAPRLEDPGFRRVRAGSGFRYLDAKGRALGRSDRRTHPRVW